MALLDAGMEAFSSSRLFDDYDDSANWLESAIETHLTDNKHDIWQGGAASAEPAQPAQQQPAWPARSACDGYAGSSSGSSTASASPSRMQSDMLDVMDICGDFEMPACNLDLPDCFDDLPELPCEAEAAFTSPASIRADVMFSSSLGRPSRNRDNSLTLSECADSLFKDLDILGAGPDSGSGLNAFFDTPMASENEEGEGSDTEQEEEEIEVVDNKTIVANNTTYYVSGGGGGKKKGVKAGKSLLRKNHKRAPPIENYTGDRPRPSASILESAQLDHCYSSTTPPPPPPPEELTGALSGSAQTPLTPTASSDDECERQGRGMGRQSLLGKRKYPGAEPDSSMDDGELKFKFRMKFGSSYSPDRRRGHGPAEDHVMLQPVEEEEIGSTQQRHGPKRKSAMKNTHCPSPAKEQQPSPPHHHPASPPKLQVNAKPAATSGSSLKALRKAVRPERRSTEASRPTGEQKCRELRDLHNSMERQRRVDLKINFDQLKDKVPELRDTDKASKMVILNKAAEYSRLLLKTDVVLAGERDRVAKRNAELRQRLEAAKRSFAGRDSVPAALGFHSISRHSISRRQHHHPHPGLIRY